MLSAHCQFYCCRYGAAASQSEQDSQTKLDTKKAYKAAKETLDAWKAEERKKKWKSIFKKGL
jgi:hypothetical protein